MKELVPLNQHVVLSVTNGKEKTTTSGLIIPDTVKEEPSLATVITVGNIDNADIAIGDTVLFRQYAGTKVELDGNKYLLMPYAEILAKIVETEEL